MTQIAEPGRAEKTLVVLLSHQPAREVERTIDTWKPLLAAGSLLLAYGGQTQDFSQINFAPKVFIDAPRLRLRDQQRGQQSWTGVLQAAADFLRQAPSYEFVYLVEYDQLPLVSDLLTRMIRRLQSEGADMLAHHLHRIDGTSSAHYLYHVRERRFHEHFAAVSKRADRHVILSMLGTGSFWRREAFLATASQEEPFPIYFELFLPTMTHHLGFRVRDLAEQNPFVMPLGNRGKEIHEARRRGAWTLHPVKALPASFAPL